MKPFLAVLPLVAALCIGAVISQAADEKPKFRPFNGKIKAVDKTARTITLEGEKAQVFQITSETKITKDKKPATLEEVAVGDRVGGRAREEADGKWVALVLNAGLPAAKPAKDEEKKPEKE